MTLQRAMCSLLVFAGLTVGGEARAARGYDDGDIVQNTTTCPVSGTVVYAAGSWVGYYTDPNEPFPQTGDVSYVHAVAKNTSTCVNDAMGFDFFLPDGASFAISPATPVFCFRGRGTFSEAVPNVPMKSSCSQTPTAGNFGGSFFGYSALPPDWYLEIQVPVVFNKQLRGDAGGTAHRLTVGTSSTYGAMLPVFKPVTTPYRAQFQSSRITTNLSGTTAYLVFQLLNYYAAGQVSIDFGTTTNFGSSTPPTNVPNTSASFPHVTASLTGLTPSTTYYWRARFVTPANGTFYSATQTFYTPLHIFLPPP